MPIGYYMGGSRGGDRGSGPPEKKIGFPSNSGLNPLKITRLASQHSMVGHYRHASETPFQWRFAGGPMMAHVKWHFGPLPIPSTNPPPKKNKKTTTFVSVGPPLTKLSGSAHVLDSTLNVGCWRGSFVIFRGSGPVFLREPIVMWISRGWHGPQVFLTPLDSRMSARISDPVYWYWIQARIGNQWNYLSFHTAYTLKWVLLFSND